MSRELVVKYSDKVDEVFVNESKTSLLTNTDYDWTGAHSIKLWKVSTAPMNDYQRNVMSDNDEVSRISRFGALLDLESQTEELMLKKDRSFIFNIDALDEDETGGGVESETALARQVREVVIPEVDKYTYNVMVTNAGTVATASELTEENVYDAILDGTKEMDDAEVPETERVLVVTPDTYKILKKAVQFDNTDVGANLKLLGVVSVLDGMNVVKVPSNRLPAGFGFMIAHPCATTAPKKLEDYGLHHNTPLSSGTIVTGRICYDAFVLDNKKKGVYYHPVTATETAAE